jgi:arabinofuranosyltransferase
MFISVLSWFSRYACVDDSMIYARYIRNALDGNGLVYNLGEHIESLTSPLYCCLLLGVSKLLGGKILLSIEIIFVVTLFGACVLAEFLAPFAGVILSTFTLFYAIRGMESSLFMLMLALTIWLYREQRWNWLPLIASLMIMSRFEGGLLAVAILAVLIYRRKMPSAVSFLPAIGIVAGYLWFNHHWFGEYFPHSASTKFGQGMSGYWGRWPTSFLHVQTLVKLTTIPLSVTLMPAIAIFATAAARRSLSARNEEPGDNWALPASVFLVLLGLFYIVFNLPPYVWYYTPFYLVGVVLAASTIPRNRQWTRAMLAISFGCLFVNLWAVRRLKPDEGYELADAWLIQHAPANARIGTEEIGLIGWQLKNLYIVDSLGLVTPNNATYFAHRQPTRWLTEDNPDYVFVHVKDQLPWETPVYTSPNYVRVPGQFGEVALYARKGEPTN